jgi:hypothetical protein
VYTLPLGVGLAEFAVRVPDGDVHILDGLLLLQTKIGQGLAKSALVYTGNKFIRFTGREVQQAAQLKRAMALQEAELKKWYAQQVKKPGNNQAMRMVGSDHYNQYNKYLNGYDSIFGPPNGLKTPWNKPPGWQGPSTKKGQWLGQEGNSAFELNNTTADRYGVPRGTRVQFVQGSPDFGPFVKPTPAGKPGVFDVPGVTGFHDTDQPLIRAFLAKQAGTTQAEVAKYLSENKLIMHHFQGTTIQLVPENIHRLHHTGGAAALRRIDE